MKRTLTVTDRAATTRLDVFLAGALDLPRAQAQKLLRDKVVTVNGQLERPSYQVQTGDEVLVSRAEQPVPERVAPELEVVYEDADLIVINKPAGIASHPGAGRTAEPTVADFARSRTSDPDPERPGIVHRLDRDTSGLMVLAKTPAAKAYLQQQFRDHAVRKTYTLLAIGRVEPAEAVIRLPLDRDPAHPLRRAVVPGGREAVTRYRTLAAYPGFSLVDANPETGRTHQLRVHFAAIGHPIAGDQIYSSPRPVLGLTRQFLHAGALQFTTPSGQVLKLTSPLPPDLAGALQTLEERI